MYIPEVDKPDDILDRDSEWADLDAFARSAAPGVTIGIVWGRRRAGKSYLLRRLVEDGLYHQALDETPAASRARLANLVAQRLGVAEGTIRFDDWLVAFETLVDAARPGVVVIDEFPYLLRHNPELTSVVQRVYDDRRDGPPGRLLLCGSSLSVMASLLTGSQPLRGRARLDLRLPVFDYRQAAQFWGAGDHRVALAVDAVLGGAAGYGDLVEQGPPASLDRFGEWLGATVLNPSHALYREDEFLLREDPRITDRGLYNSILTALAAGESTPSSLGGRLGRDRIPTRPQPTRHHQPQSACRPTLGHRRAMIAMCCR